MTDEELKVFEARSKKIAKFLRKEISYLEKHHIDDDLVVHLKKTHDYFSLPEKWYDKEFGCEY